MARSDRRTFLVGLAAVMALAPALPSCAAEIIYTGLLSGTAVGGYDPVAYFKKGMPVEGKSEFVTEHAGASWYFESAESRDAFIANPASFAPQYRGHCAWAAAEGYLAKGDPAHWKIADGKLYLNYNAAVQTQWLQDVPGNIKRGDANWPKIGMK